MTRWIGMALLGFLVVLIGAALLGRAIDHQVMIQDRVITTKHGRTIDCRVDHYEDGSMYLNDCNFVRVP